MKKIIFNILFLFTVLSLSAEDGQQLWLRDKKAKPVTVICKKIHRHFLLLNRNCNKAGKEMQMLPFQYIPYDIERPINNPDDIIANEFKHKND